MRMNCHQETILFLFGVQWQIPCQVEEKLLILRSRILVEKKHSENLCLNVRRNNAYNLEKPHKGNGQAVYMLKQTPAVGVGGT